jgi:hypothetical protein
MIAEDHIGLMLDNQTFIDKIDLITRQRGAIAP